MVEILLRHSGPILSSDYYVPSLVHRPSRSTILGSTDYDARITNKFTLTA